MRYSGSVTCAVSAPSSHKPALAVMALGRALLAWLGAVACVGMMLGRHDAIQRDRR